MKYSTEKLKSLPKIEVSFQDDFSGTAREYTLTPRYVLRELEKMGLNGRIGDEILLWEKDVGTNDREYYLCNIGKIVEVSTEVLEIVPTEKRPLLNGTPIQIQIDRNGYFDLLLESDVF